MLHSLTSRPFTTQCKIEWPHPGKDFLHERGTFQKTSGLRSFYVIHPDWVSEDFNPPRPTGRIRRPGPWEFPGARGTYETPAERLRGRMLSDRAVAEEKKRLGEHHEAYQTWHNSPWYVNNPDINPQANSLYHRDPKQPHTLPHNNARRILYTELNKPPMAQRFKNGDLSPYFGKIQLPDIEQTPAPSAVAAANFRLMSNSYKTYCDWG